MTLTLLMALERLSPLERAAFLLHDVFGVDFEEVAETIGREPAACRQLASRARPRPASRPASPCPRARAADRRGVLRRPRGAATWTRLRSLLAEDVALHADGGGKASAAKRPITGLENVVRLHAGLARHLRREPSALRASAQINGLPGFITVEGDGTVQTTALQVEDGKVVAIYVVRNPDKLRHLAVDGAGAGKRQHPTRTCPSVGTTWAIFPIRASHRPCVSRIGL